MATVFVPTAYAQRATVEDIYGDSVSGEPGIISYIVLLILGAAFVWRVIKDGDLRSSVFKVVGGIVGLVFALVLCETVFGKEWAMIAAMAVGFIALMKDPSFGDSNKQKNNNQIDAAPLVKSVIDLSAKADLDAQTISANSFQIQTTKALKKESAVTMKVVYRTWYKTDKGIGDKFSDLFIDFADTLRDMYPVPGYTINKTVRRNGVTIVFISDREIDDPKADMNGGVSFFCPYCDEKNYFLPPISVDHSCKACANKWQQKLKMNKIQEVRAAAGKALDD